MLLLEPLDLQVSGRLPQREFDAVPNRAMANRGLIDRTRDGWASSFEKAVSRVRKVAATGWRQS